MIFFTPVKVKYMKNDLNIKKPRYSEQSLPVPWPFVILRFHCSNCTPVACVSTVNQWCYAWCIYLILGGGGSKGGVKIERTCLFS